MGRVAAPRGRAAAATVVAALVVTAVIAVVAGPASASTFTNASTITIPTSGTATPYPSNIDVSGLSGTVSDVNVTLHGLGHTWPSDIDVLLVGPAGQRVILMADTGGDADVAGLNLTFDDAAVGYLPTLGPLSTGTYRPTNGGAFNGTPPAPASPYSVLLSSFNGTNPTGIWSLYVFDDVGGDSGQIAAGWSLDITTNAPTITSFTPTSGTPGTLVSITGTNFSGTTAVRFGGVPATAFIENSSTSISATVPVGAISGPISVTTPQGTGISLTPFNVTASPPSIASFTPIEGSVGTLVTINGANLDGATAVTFNGTTAAFSPVSPTQVSATVPLGATTGPIAVTTAGGTATSLTAFFVRHERTVSLAVGKAAKGTVAVLDSYLPCQDNVRVKVQYRSGGRFRTLGFDFTDKDGKYSVPGARQISTSSWRATAKGFELASGDRCVKAVATT